MTEGWVLAHGIASREDLPLPFGLALYGSGAALLVSFVALGLLWRTPRLRGSLAGVALPSWLAAVVDAPAPRLVQRAIGAVITAYILVTAFGSPDDALNPTADVAYVLLWVGLPLVSLVVGPVGRRFSPVRALHAALAAVADVDPHTGTRELPERLGYFPAAAGLAVFTFLELAAPHNTSARLLGVCAVAYLAGHAIAGLVYGDRWFDRAESFEVYSALAARLSFFGRRADGALVVRNPLDGLAGTPVGPGFVLVITVLLGSTLWDSASSTTAVQDQLQSSGYTGPITKTIGLALMIALVTALYSLVVPTTTPDAPTVDRSTLPLRFAHSFIPIVIGYAVAHYFSLLVFEGQRGLLLLTDPLGTGADLFGVAGRTVDFTAISPRTISVVQVAAIVIGHIIAVISAHDRAVALFPPSRAVRGQLPLLALMVVFTCGGIALLFAA